MRKSYLLSTTCYLLLLIFFSAGCARTKAQIEEFAKCFAGISTRELEQARPGALKMEFACDYASAFSKAKETLRNQGYYIYAQSAAEGMVAAYVSETDTTPVGIFFKELAGGRIEAEVASPAAYAKEAAAKKLFSVLLNSCQGQAQVKNAA